MTAALSGALSVKLTGCRHPYTIESQLWAKPIGLLERTKEVGVH